VVADDEEVMRHFVTRALARHGYEVVAADGGEVAIDRFTQTEADVAVVDLKMPGMDGIEVLTALRQRRPDAIVILMTAFGTIPSAVHAMRLGATDYVTKPFEIETLTAVIERALERRAATRDGRRQPAPADHRSGLVGESEAMRAVHRAIDLVKDSDATVLITGESGTGKELVARAVHAGSRRAAGPFVPLHCAALHHNLIDSELFGHVAGAFTGAVRPKRGLIARADGGTLFLDEIGDVGFATQAKLERVLQEKSFFPLGGSEIVRVDFRVIAATSRDLDAAVRAGGFRRELFFRLNVVPIHLPPLRERREDIPLLANHFLATLRPAGSAVRRFSDEAMVALANHGWSGNIRELQNTVEHLIALYPDREEIGVEQLPHTIHRAGGAHARGGAAASGTTLHAAVSSAERTYFEGLLRQTRGNIRDAARLAGLSRGHLYRKISRLGLDPQAFRG
jgi:DNA-binding NtrC family response regulator